MLSKAGSRIYSLAQEHVNYPVKVFGLLNDGRDELAQQLVDERPCRFDEWTEDLIAAYRDQEGGLLSPALLSELKSTAYMLEFENAATEARHAGIRRSIFAASLHTHTEKAQLANSEWALRMMRKITHPSRANRRAKRGATASPTNAPERKKRGGGGPWRAFVREESFGQVGRPDLKALGESYRRLPSEERKRLELKGAEAIAAAAAGSKAFGCTSREVTRASRKRAFAEACEHGMALLPVGRPRLALPDLSCAPGALVPAIAPASSGDPLARVREFKASLRQERAIELARTKVVDDALASFEGSDSAKLEEVGFLPTGCLAQRQPEFIARPTPPGDFQAYTWRPSAVAQRVGAALGVRQNTSVAKAADNSLQTIWDKARTTFQEERQPVLGEVSAKSLQRPCHAAGKCMLRAWQEVATSGQGCGQGLEDGLLPRLVAAAEARERRGCVRLHRANRRASEAQVNNGGEVLLVPHRRPLV